MQASRRRASLFLQPNNRPTDRPLPCRLTAVFLVWVLCTSIPSLQRRLPRTIFGVLGFGGLLFHYSRDVDFVLYDPVSALLRKVLDPEAAHKLVMITAKAGLLPRDNKKDEEMLRSTVMGLKFPNPVGLAAGFDKDCEVPIELLRMGFGHIEVGTLTPLPQAGTPKPRIFRLTENEAIINRCGFPNKGAAEGRIRLMETSVKRWLDPLARNCVIGVSIGKNKDKEAAKEDYIALARSLGPYGDYVVINVSSPNTPGLRGLQKDKELEPIVRAVQAELKSACEELESKHQLPRTQSGNKVPPRVLVKISPDMSAAEMSSVARTAVALKVDGLVVANTTLTRPEGLTGPHREQTGGLSGRPLRELSKKCVSYMYKETSGTIPIIASGGIANGQDALEAIEAGASLVQIYTAFVYGSPKTARKIKDELGGLLRSKGYRSIEEAVGAGHRKK
eukprot:GHVU01047116.1.p1 GENE.GHVU01047116.1~~GHVU01047116.1.p1  ORF type:complete len:448 (-),score=65.07 GHVU01047116.1:374-1717(-)